MTGQMRFEHDDVIAVREAFHRRLKAFAAPVAGDRGAVTEDLDQLEVARAIHAAFGDHEAYGGLTRAELAQSCAHVCGRPQFDRYFELFLKMELIEPFTQRDYEWRYVLNPASSAALLVFGRLEASGGLQELVTLLDATYRELELGSATSRAVAEALVQARREFTIRSGHLRRLVRHRPLEELIAEQRHHGDAKRLFTQAERIVERVNRDFGEHRRPAERMAEAALQYVNAVQEYMARLLDQAAQRRDFTLLDAEAYLTAAITGSPEALAAVFDGIVFDPPRLHLSPHEVLRTIETHQPRPRPRQRRPRREDPLPEGDPVEEAAERLREYQAARRAAIEAHLGSEDGVDLTERLRGTPWRQAARVIADVLVSATDPDLPFEPVLGDRLHVTADAPTTYVSELGVRAAEPERATTTQSDRDG
ncbi:hypothetical protein [Actinoallomurus sp. NPDC050550]|uniref:hypothetical protein n=1 Tax=Actinoallomurus sp. NPDC050550 TaxID=3154937 RepID=UPI0033F98BAB